MQLEYLTFLHLQKKVMHFWKDQSYLVLDLCDGILSSPVYRVWVGLEGFRLVILSVITSCI